MWQIYHTLGSIFVISASIFLVVMTQTSLLGGSQEGLQASLLWTIASAVIGIGFIEMSKKH